MGTAAYMSPEQASGKPVDRRTDIWSFGCVLYEMLTGTRAFGDDDPADVLASVLAREPDWTRLPSGLPPGLVAHLRRCLHKNPKQRIGDIQDMRLALDGAFESAMAAPPGPTSARGWRRRVAPVAGGLVVAGLTSAAVWYFGRSGVTEAPQISRLQIPLPESAAVTVSADSRNLAITPDGRRVVYVGDAGRQLFVRAMEALEPTAIYSGAPREGLPLRTASG